MKDGRKVYENGFGPDQVLVNPPPVWGNAPASQSLIYAFDNNEGNRTNQDIGFDGLPSAEEAKVYTNYASEPDPAGDDYTLLFKYYLEVFWTVIKITMELMGIQMLILIRLIGVLQQFRMWKM